MNPHLCRVALRPRDLLEVFDLTLRFTRARWRPHGLLFLIVVIPVWGLLSAAVVVFDGHPLLLTVPLLIAAPLQAPFTVLAGNLLFNDDVRVRDVLRETAHRMPALLGAWSVRLCAWALAVLLSCGVLIPFVQAGLLYTTEAALLERVGPQRGLRRSLRLASGHVGIALVGALSWWMLTLWFAVIGEASGQGLVDTVLQMGHPFGSLLEQRATPWMIGGMIAAQPLHAVYRLLLYVDVRTRVEGWDLQVALRAAGLGCPSA